MRDELEAKILADFPKLYPDRCQLITDYAPFSFECADGWYDLIYRLSYTITSIIENDEELAKHEPKVFQIKEKWGTLRFYMSRYSDELHEVIAEAEKESEKICETCGVQGDGVELKSDSWVRTICEECEAERVRKWEEQKREWAAKAKKQQAAE